MGQALNTRTPKYNGGDKGCQKKKSQGKNARRKRLEERGYQEKGILRGRNDKYSEARSFFGTASCLSPELAPSCLAIHYDVRCRIDALKASPAAGHCFSGKTDGKRGSHFHCCWLCIHPLGFPFPEHRQEISRIACPGSNSDVVRACWGGQESVKSPLLNHAAKKVTGFQRQLSPCCSTSTTESCVFRIRLHPQSAGSQTRETPAPANNVSLGKRNQAAACLLRLQIFYL